MTIGERIRQRRVELKMSQDELAKRLGYKSRSSVNKIELGIHNLTQSKIKAIADALETTPDYIMGWESGAAAPQIIQATPKPDLIESELLGMFKRMDTIDKGRLLGLAQEILAAEKYQKKKGV